MASKKKSAPRYLTSPAAWFRGLLDKQRAFENDDDYLEAALIERKRFLEKAYLTNSIKTLRKYVKGFEPKDGYALSKVAFIPPEREKLIRKYVPILNSEISSTEGRSVEIVPKSTAQRQALIDYTGQDDIPNRKRFIIYTDKPDTARVKFIKTFRVAKDADGKTIKDKKTGKAKRVEHMAVEVEHKVSGGAYRERFFMLPKNLISFEQVYAATKKLLPFMPKGYYVFVTSSHGNISAPMRKEAILGEIQDKWMDYDVISGSGKDNRGLVETVVGYKLTGVRSSDAEYEYNERITNSIRLEQARAARRAAERRKVLSKLKVRF